jgi:Helix-turn-helix domain
VTPLRFAWTHAVRDSDLSPSVKLVGLVWATYMGTDGLGYPGVAKLCARTGLTRRTVQRSLRSLVDACLLEPVYVKGGAGRASEYRATLPKGATGGAVPGGERAPQGTRKGATGDTPTVKNSGRAPRNAAHPLGDCARCGADAPLVDDRALYCASCVREEGQAVA